MTEYTKLSMVRREGQWTDEDENHLESSLRRAEELGALFAAGGSVRILVDSTELEASPVKATVQQRWRLSVGVGELQTARAPIGRLAE